jgi:transketolase
MREEEIKKLTEVAREIRVLTIEAMADLGVGHLGGAMSIVDLLALLYFRQMRVNPLQPDMQERDKLVLSKGHAGPALYSALAVKGYFPREWLFTLNRGGTRLPSHCDMNKTPGIDMTTGSLGQGISAAIGLALADRLDHLDTIVYLILGDGESNEGQVWEGAMAAAHFKLSNIIAFTDYNGLQIDGAVKEIMGLEDLSEKWRSFGWFVQRVDGHSFNRLEEAIVRAKKEAGRPSMIIMDTVKGKGIPFAEGTVESHNMPITAEQCALAVSALRAEEKGEL